MRFEKQALTQLAAVRGHFTGPIKVTYIFYLKGRLNLDLDNGIASINDVLQKAGIIDDDKNVVEIEAKKINGNKDWKTIIDIAKDGI